jgi:hypothetical protein
LKYFTSEWWGLVGSADPDPGAEMDPVPVDRAYYELVRGVLPPDLVAAHDQEPLHDATLHVPELDAVASRGWSSSESSSNACVERRTPCPTHARW